MDCSSYAYLYKAVQYYSLPLFSTVDHNSASFVKTGPVYKV